MNAKYPVVLNVNDHVANRYIVTKMLRNAGFEVVEAATGREAIALCSGEEKPALVVLDVRLPDLDGFEVCRHLKTNDATKDIKILHTSATHTTTDSRIAGLEAGSDGYLTQPFEPQELIATVRALIRLYDAERHLQEQNDLLVENDRRKDEFLAMLAHELRNPLAAIELGLPLIGEDSNALSVVQRQTALLTQLVDDLLDVSRVTRGRIELQQKHVALGPLVTSVCDLMRERTLEPREQHLDVGVCSSPIVVHGDPNRLEQVLTNLLDNASKYSDPGTPISVRLDKVDGFAHLTVRDHGIGIDSAMLPRVFDLFMQATTSLARSRGGLGIGLTLVKALVELHNGTISATSAGRGQGTTFFIRLPLAVEALAEPRGGKPEIPVRAEPLSILLVDDNEDARMLLATLCERAGHRVAEAGDGVAAVQTALDVQPEIAFIDIGLPELDGYEVARRIRAKATWHPRLIALSGYGSAEHRQLAMQAGFDEHIVKPINIELLRRIIGVAVTK